ncbi:hypothetical protein, partial [Escherichia coli]|uniref:hypothetical protein n=1 Tax=Escherichia coli TaxID=562 RepID=UPI001BFCBE41
KSAQIREILINESAWEEMTCLFAPSQINPGAGPEITTPWKSYQHEKNRNGLMPLIRRRTMLQL